MGRTVPGLLFCLSLAGLLQAEDWLFQRQAAELPAEGVGGQLKPGADTWLHLHPDGRGRLLFQLSAPPGSDLDLEVFSGDGQVLAQSLQLDSAEQALVDTEQARHFLVRVVNRGADATGFRLQAQVYPGFAALPFGQEHRAALGSAHRRDVFRVPLLRGRWVLELDGEPFESSLELEVFAADGQPLAASRREGNEQRVELYSSHFREVFVYVSLRGEPLGAQYTLRLDGPWALPRLEPGRTELPVLQTYAGWLLLEPGNALACEARAAEGADFGLELGDALGRVQAAAQQGRAALLYAGRGETVYVELNSGQPRKWLQLALPESGPRVDGPSELSLQGPRLVAYHSASPGILEVAAERGQVVLFDAQGRSVSEGHGQLLAAVAAGQYRLLLWQTASAVSLRLRRDQDIATRLLAAGDVFAGRAGQGALFSFEGGEGQVWDVRVRALDDGGRLGLRLVGSDGSVRLAGIAAKPRLSFNAGPGTRYVLQTVAAGGASGAAFAGLAETCTRVMPPPAAGDGEAHWGVFVGISDYARLTDLQYCAFDALDLARQGIASGGIAHPRAVCLIDEQATLAGLRGVLRELSARLGPGGRCQLFFSGHGGLVADADGDELDGYDEALCLWDADGQAGLLKDDELARLLGHLKGEQVVYLDACFAGGFQRDLSDRSGRFALFSSQEDRLSREGVDFQAGLLSHLLQEGLAGAADAGGDGQVSAVELEDFVLRRMPLSCPSCNALARPGDRACAACQRGFVGSNRLQHAVALRYLDAPLILSRP